LSTSPPFALSLSKRPARATLPFALSLSKRRRRRSGLALLLLAGAGAAPAQDEVPFITTPDTVTLAMLQLAGVGPVDTLVDLGSGDGRIVITAARRFGARGLGVEIVPDLVAKSRANARAAGVADRADFREQDLFTLDLAPYSVITMYLLPQVNLQLRPRLLALKPGTRIVSHDWDLGDWQPDRSLTLDVPDKPIGRDKKSTLHLWVVPARLAGWWCGADVALHVAQHYQRVSVTMQRRGQAPPAYVFDGRARADGLHEGEQAAAAGVVATLDGDTLRMARVRGVAAIGFEGARLRASGVACF
jgi:SAM-dependent methyltransferase